MKRTKCGYWLGTGLATAVLLSVATAWASDDPNNAGANAPPQSSQSDASNDQRDQQVSGRITAIDTAAQTITVKALLLSKVVKVGSDAQISVEGNASAALSDLKVGDRVQVSYRLDGDTLNAQRITRTSSGSKESQGGSPSAPIN